LTLEECFVSPKLRITSLPRCTAGSYLFTYSLPGMYLGTQ